MFRTSLHLTMFFFQRHGLYRVIQEESAILWEIIVHVISKQKSSYEHGSDFERLPRYGKKKIRTILRTGFLFMVMAEGGGVPHQSG